jgi:hypothetical protein
MDTKDLSFSYVSRVESTPFWVFRPISTNQVLNHQKIRQTLLSRFEVLFPKIEYDGSFIDGVLTGSNLTIMRFA